MLHVTLTRFGKEAQRFFPETVGVGGIKGIGRDAAGVPIAVCDHNGLITVLEVAASNALKQRRGG